MTAAGIALATVAVLVGVLVPRVVAAASDVVAARTPVASVDTSDVGLHVETSSVVVDGRQWTRVVATGAEKDSPRPPGLAAWPAVGRTAVSPALATLVARDADVARMVGPLSPGRVTAAGVAAPDELVSYTVADRPTRAAGRDSSPVVRFGSAGGDDGGSGLLLALEILVLVLLPTGVFLWTALRLTAASRASRSFALGLAGMSPSRIARLAGREMAVVAAGGYLAGAAVYVACQAWLGSSGLLGVTWWPRQGDLGWVAVAVLGLPVVAVVSTIARRAAKSAATRSRSQRERSIPRWHGVVAVVLALPAAGFLLATAVVGIVRPSDVWASDRHALLVVASLLAAFVAVVLGVPTLLREGAVLLASRAGPATALGLRGAVHRLDVARRLVVLVGCAVMVAGLSAGVLQSLQRRTVGVAADTTLSFALGDLPRGAVDDLPAGPVTIETSAETGDGRVSVVVADCDAVRRQSTQVFDQPPRCSEGVQRGADSDVPTELVLAGETVRVPTDAEPTRDVVWDVKFPVADAPWLGDVVDAQVTYWIPRDDPAFEATFTALVDLHPALRIDADLKNSSELGTYREQVGTLRAAIAIGLLLSVSAFALAAVEARWQRTRSLAVLAAAGAPSRDLRTSNLVELVFPVAASVVPSVVVGTLGGWAYLSVTGSAGMFDPGVPGAAALGGTAAVVVAAVTGWLTGGASFRRQDLVDT